MNCNKIKKQIYLYKELTAAEKKTLERHVAGCADCREVFQQIMQQNTWMHELAMERPSAKDPQRMVNGILRAIEPKVFSSRQAPVFLLAGRLWLRYTLSAVSILLILFFLAEHPWRNDLLRTQSTATLRKTKNKPVLNTSLFLESYRRHRGTPDTVRFASLHDCIIDETCAGNMIRNFKNKEKI